ncbi:MAG TPA: hypothetical protein VF651_08355 [Gammaproteobacteria bacterium]
MSTIETICEALATRSLLQICYDDHYRIVEPNAYGADPRGNQVLLAYQTEGGGGHDSRAGWRVLDIRAMKRVSVLTEHFLGPRPRTGRDETRIERGFKTAIAAIA